MFAEFRSQPEGSEMEADIRFKITVFGLSALSTLLVSAVLFAL